MLGWLTRNDGARIARARRRLASARGSVFSEFALVVPIVMLACSALIEVAGYWDAQVMANHSAWTVGRIVTVRGSDGLAFSSDLDKKSKTGIPSSDMPDAIKKLLDDINKGIAGANKFNNRGNIATLFLMSTCGVGYYGSSPGKTLSDGFNKLCEAAVEAITDGIPEWVKSAVAGIELPSFVPGAGDDSEISKFVNKIVGTIVDKIADAALKPIAEAIGDLLKEAVKKAIGEDGIKIDELFNGKSAAARNARQIYGAASRIVRANATIGKEVVAVKDMDDLKGGYLFAKNSVRGRLVYPQVVDKEAKSDGYFVTGVHGWPANEQGLAMAHVEIDWPYESGWLFPVVSGRASAADAKPVVATGHSMVFPQPNIANENLYSAGAKAYEDGSYKNDTAVPALEELAKEMKNYLKFVKFCLRYRICEDTLSYGEGPWHWGDVYYWKYVPELKDLWPFDSGDGDSYPVGGEYAKCWKELTGKSDQSPDGDDFKKALSNCRSKDYFYWEGNYHARYGTSLCHENGNAGLAEWYDQHAGLCYRSSRGNQYVRDRAVFMSIFAKHKSEIDAAIYGGVNADWLFGRIFDFAKRNHVNVHNLVKWQEGHDLAAWERDDRAVHTEAKAAEKSFRAIKDLIHDEIRDIEKMENGTSTWSGDEDDPVLDPNDEEVMKDPDAAARKAREKWSALKANLKKKLRDVDTAAGNLRDEWSRYQSAVKKFKDARKACVREYFVEGCIRTLIRTKDRFVFDRSDDSSFQFPAGAFPYDIGKGTRDMLASVRAYKKRLDEAYKQEVEYGAMMGLQSASKAKREGKTPDQVVDEADEVKPDKPGSLSPGSDTGAIIDKDHQTYGDGGWKWD